MNSSLSRPSFTLLPMVSLAVRELMRFYRQRSRIIGSLATPLIFWVFLGAGLSTAFPAPPMPGGKGYLEFFFPGNLILTLLFTAIFSCISIIEDRNEGFLQGVLVAPVTRVGLVGGKVLGGAILATLQGLLFLALAPLAGFSLTLYGLFLAVTCLVVTAFSLTALGFAFAWHFNSVQGFHGIMNMVLFPMWLLSGAFFPVERAPLWLRGIMYANPLTYGTAALEHALYAGSGANLSGLPSYSVSVGVTLLFALLFFAASLFVVGYRRGAAAP